MSKHMGIKSVASSVDFLPSSALLVLYVIGGVILGKKQERICSLIWQRKS